MAQATNKNTRGAQYNAIMEHDDFGPDEWTVLAFAFEDETGPERFHFRLLLAEMRPVFYLFNCHGNIADVIAPKEDWNAGRIREIAESVGGHKTTPDLR